MVAWSGRAATIEVWKLRAAGQISAFDRGNPGSMTVHLQNGSSNNGDPREGAHAPEQAQVGDLIC